MNKHMKSWLISLSDTAEMCVRVYCELGDNASPMVKRFVWEKAYLADCSQIVKEEVREEIKKFYKKYDKLREIDFSFEAAAVAA